MIDWFSFNNFYSFLYIAFIIFGISYISDFINNLSSNNNCTDIDTCSDNSEIIDLCSTDDLNIDSCTTIIIEKAKYDKALLCLTNLKNEINNNIDNSTTITDNKILKSTLCTHRDDTICIKNILTT